MSYFYTSPTSNILPQPHPSAVRMTRTDSSSSTTSTTSTISIPTSSRPGSSSASLCFSSSPSSATSSSYIHCRISSNGTSYLPTPFRSSLMHSCSRSEGPGAPPPSSYFSDEELLFLPVVESTHLAPSKRELTTEEQIALMRELRDAETERAPGIGAGVGVGYDGYREKRTARVVRFVCEDKRRSSGGGPKRGSVLPQGVKEASSGSRRD